ncbi:MAG: A/G-specific adenine glycosylase [Kiritimatiellaceae bacterium]|nr:A/G-specific adenine glycosylase [Kiritimatiellaceae bacterium]
MNHDLKKLRLSVSASLIPWFEVHQRKMPWRRNRSPYRVWISELMLQQTRVSQATPYYLRFMQKFPSLKKLSEANLEEVLKAWEGLGYYSRARNLHKTAIVIRNHYGGRFPRDPEKIAALPGIGPYTTAAICSLAFNLNLAVVDGNVIRVLSRLLAIKSDIALQSSKKEFQTLADALLIKGRAGIFNEAMMELGATVCLPQNPDCTSCPMMHVCKANYEGSQTQYPVKQKKKKVPKLVVGAAVVKKEDGTVLVAQRREDQMLGGLWEFPGGKQETNESILACVIRELKEELDIDVELFDKIICVNHAYSHFKMEMHVFWARIRSGEPRAIECKNFKWISLTDIRSLPFSKADLKVIDAITEAD